MLKTILFGFMDGGYASLRELEDRCKSNQRYKYLMKYEVPSYRTFGYFIEDYLEDGIEEIFQAVNKHLFEKEGVEQNVQSSFTYFLKSSPSFHWSAY